MMLPKKIRKRDPTYLAWVRTKECLAAPVSPICNEPIDAHHILPIGEGKTGGKTDDSRAVPMCRFHHFCYHDRGRFNAEVAYAINFEKVIKELNREYARLHSSIVRKERKRPMKVKVHVLNCSACGHLHRSAKGEVVEFLCVDKNVKVRVP